MEKKNTSEAVYSPFSLREEGAVEIPVLSPNQLSRRGVMSRADSLTAVNLAKEARRSKIVNIADFRRRLA